MSEFIEVLSGGLCRASLGIALAAVVVEILTRRLRVQSPRLEQLAWGLVLLQGIWLVPIRISVPVIAAPTRAAVSTISPSPLSTQGGEVAVAHETAINPEPMGKLGGTLEADRSFAKQAEPNIAAWLWKNSVWIAMTIWGAGVVFFFSLGMTRYVAYVIRLQKARHAPADWAHEWETLLSEYKVTTPVPVMIMPFTGPSLVRLPNGYRLVLAESDWNQLSLSQRESVLRHELAHFLRGDLWTVFAARCVALVHWFNPCAWWAVSRFEMQTEFLCDQFASDNSSVDLASALIQLGSNASPSLPALKSVRDGSLVERVRRLLGEAPAAARWSSVLIVLVASLAILPNAIEFQQVAANDPKQNAQASSDAADAKQANPPDAAANTPSADPTEPSFISGQIELIDNSPATAQGWMYYHSQSASGSGSGVDGQYRDKFRTKVPTGDVRLYYFAEGYAPTSAGRFAIKPGESLERINFKLERGYSLPLRIVNAAGEGIARVKFSLAPVWDSPFNTTGPLVEHLTNERGEFRLEHLAETRYIFQLAAAGYEPLRTEPLQLAKSDKPLTITLTASKPARGTVFLSDGSAAPKASLFLLHEIDRPGVSHDHSTQDAELASTDAHGKFVLDSLADGSDYLFGIRTADGAGVVTRRIKAGQTDLRITVPPRRDIKLRVRGDFSQLPQRDGKPFFQFRKRIEFIPAPGRQFNCLITGDIPMEVTPTGEQSAFPALIDEDSPHQQFEISLGNLPSLTKQFELSQQETTEVEFELPVVEPKSKPEPSEFRGTNYLIVPLKKTELQDHIIGASGESREHFRAYVLIDGNSVYSRDGRLDQDALNWDQLANQLRPFADRKQGIVTFHTYHFNLSVNSKDVLSWALEGFGERRAGFHKTYVSQTFAGPGDFWKTIDLAAASRKGKAEGEERSIGNDLVRVYPVETFLSRYITDQTDCVVRIVPRLTKNTGNALPAEIQESLESFVPTVAVADKRKLLFVVRYENAADPTVRWLESAVNEMAHQFGYQSANVSSARY